VALYVGLMSGTSADSVDAAIVEISGESIRLLATHRHAMPDDIRSAVFDLFDGHDIAITRFGALDCRIGRTFAETTLELLSSIGVAAADVSGIGSHGQTVHHHPRGSYPYTIQLGDPNIIAELTGITTVADFRRRDIAAGGEGAPLVPAFHAAMLRTGDEDRAVVNIGGIANITVLPALRQSPVLGFDCGPGNALLDAWASRHLHEPMDRDARWASTGTVLPGLLHAMRDDEFFGRPPPKSTGREHFNLRWLDRLLMHAPGASARDVARTLAELTVRAITAAVTRFAPMTRRVLVCGGGACNPLLMTRLAEMMGGVAVAGTDSLGLAPQWVESQAFAWLAHRTLCGLPGNLPSVTGASREVVLGGIFPGRTRHC
jgi:anhydro-N-acetylmuramic acid kinase